MKPRLLARMLLALFLAATVVIGAQAQGEIPTDDEVNAIAKKLYCPVCPNTPLDVCETKACQDWRAQIRDQLAAGWSEQQIIDYFVAQYGERVLAEPQRKGFTALVWILPAIAAPLGLVGVVSVVRRWKRPPPGGSPTPLGGDGRPVDARTLELIEKELEKIA